MEILNNIFNFILDNIWFLLLVIPMLISKTCRWEAMVLLAIKCYTDRIPIWVMVLMIICVSLQIINDMDNRSKIINNKFRLWEIKLSKNNKDKDHSDDEQFMDI